MTGVSGFAGKVALVTGAGSGIGRATALAFAQAGAHVVLVDRDAAGTHETLEAILQGGGTGLAAVCDVTDPNGPAAAVSATVAKFRRLDAAVNAAGVEGAWITLADEPIELFDKVMTINVRGVWLCMQAEIRQMLTQPEGGAIVNVSSGAGLVGSARSAVYSASKHAVVGLTKSGALQYASRGIRINAVCPGGVETPMVERIYAQAPGAASAPSRKNNALGRYSTPEEIAAGIVWLCSPGAASIAGTALPIDGGFTAA